LLDKYISRYIILIKPIEFYGHTLRTIRGFPARIRQEIGYELDRVQRGLNPSDWKPLPTVGKGAREIRIREGGQYRVVYVTKVRNTIYVLHAFRKKTQKTRQHDIKAARTALRKLLYRNSS
jgi:phage-related protein